MPTRPWPERNTVAYTSGMSSQEAKTVASEPLSLSLSQLTSAGNQLIQKISSFSVGRTSSHFNQPGVNDVFFNLIPWQKDFTVKNKTGFLMVCYLSHKHLDKYFILLLKVKP